MGLMADILRLPDETLAMAFIYVNRFTKYTRSAEAVPALDSHTLALSSISLASKSTGSPRRLRSLLVPAHRLLHSASPNSTPLAIPSTLYDTLRHTLVRAELILLRVLKFELRIPLPLEFLPRYLDRTIGELNVEGGGWGGTECYEEFEKDRREEFQVMSLMETGVGMACRIKAVEACKDYQLANFFPARALAAACVYITFQNRGLDIGKDRKAWLGDITGRKVDVEDFEEAVTIIRS
ncbi:hypothetical protein K432DRAFT_425724 [Lepidopterella palustris CBS 459.81]|uniref:Cyclin-like protein n=1 Tax=Lepidopterella palustris CBS 459.81 TaxID=1314670 RepID=A0A8E2EB03_9PEZI|nr:hypothetical protein K432DRAFT_425724 [Lepidopterella palustris CBS 459.81]